MFGRLMCLLFIPCLSMAQSHTKFFIRFADRANSPYSISVPSDYLSAKAIARRAQQNIAIVDNDLPVNPSYVQGVQNTGARVLTRSKWMNGVTVECDSTQLQAISALPYVISSTTVNRMRPDSHGKSKFKSGGVPYNSTANLARSQSLDYGMSFNQIHLMNGEYLHEAGFKGEGMTIAVLDAGFFSVDQLAPFDSIRSSGQILNPGRRFGT